MSAPTIPTIVSTPEAGPSLAELQPPMALLEGYDEVQGRPDYSPGTRDPLWRVAGRAAIGLVRRLTGRQQPSEPIDISHLPPAHEPIDLAVFDTKVVPEVEAEPQTPIAEALGEFAAASGAAAEASAAEVRTWDAAAAELSTPAIELPGVARAMHRATLAHFESSVDTARWMMAPALRQGPWKNAFNGAGEATEAAADRTTELPADVAVMASLSEVRRLVRDSDLVAIKDVPVLEMPQVAEAQQLAASAEPDPAPAHDGTFAFTSAMPDIPVVGRERSSMAAAFRRQ